MCVSSAQSSRGIIDSPEDDSWEVFAICLLCLKIMQAIRDDIKEQIGGSSRSEQQEGDVISRKLNALAYDKADGHSSPGQLRTIIESDGL